MCLIDKPGALKEMAGRGYFTVLLRDCTAAMETHNSVGDLSMTRLFVEWIELLGMACTATSADFIAACKV